MSEKKSIPASIGSKLRLLRTMLTMKQGALSDRMKVPQSTVANLETCENMNLKTLDKYIRGLGLEYSIVVIHPVLGKVTLHEIVFKEK